MEVLYRKIIDKWSVLHWHVWWHLRVWQPYSWIIHRLFIYKPYINHIWTTWFTTWFTHSVACGLPSLFRKTWRNDPNWVVDVLTTQWRDHFENHEPSQWYIISTISILFICVYTYIYIERERYRYRYDPWQWCIYIYNYIYTYIYIRPEIEG